MSLLSKLVLLFFYSVFYSFLYQCYHNVDCFPISSICSSGSFDVSQPTIVVEQFLAPPQCSLRGPFGWRYLKQESLPIVVNCDGHKWCRTVMPYWALHVFSNPRSSPKLAPWPCMPMSQYGWNQSQMNIKFNKNIIFNIFSKTSKLTKGINYFWNIFCLDI
jgi:hypothetical protein